MPSIQTPPGRIVHLEMENFKSYKGHQLVGPFKDLTAIIGPNGAGKSNLMDAISFVLGVRTGQLRGSQLKDLIYAFDDREKEQRGGRKAFVRLVYLLDKEGVEELLRFTRTITSSGGSKYRIDDRVVSWEEYNGKLRSIGILVKARNFLVFQGDVESVASKNSKELSGLVEQICGSDELKKEYEELEEKKASAEEKAALIYQKKKTIGAEKKLKKAHKEEAEKHLKLQDELKALKREYFLWQLYNIENDIDKANEDVDAEKNNRKDVAAKLEKFEHEAGKRKIEQAKFLKEIAQREKKIAERSSNLGKYQPELLRLKEEIARIKSKIESSRKEVDKRKKEKGKHSEEIEQMQKSIKDLNEKINELNERRQDSSSGKLPMPDSHLQEYFRIKQEAWMKTIKLRDEKEVLDRQYHTDLEALRNLEENYQQLINRENDLDEQIERMKSRLKEIEDSSSEYKKETTNLKKQLPTLQEKHRDARNASEKLKTRITELEDQLSDLTAERYENERYSRLTQAGESLKLTVAMGRFMDAVVVEDENTGKDCIKYLKEQRLPPMTFIPLQSVRVKPVLERLRNLDGTAKLAFDVIQYPLQIKLEKAVLFAVGNTLVCDDLDEAKRLSWTGERFKVVTVDGIILTMAGTMTGGTSGGMEAKSNKWDDKKIEGWLVTNCFKASSLSIFLRVGCAGLMKKKEEYELELEKVGSIRDMQIKESEISGKISGLEKKIQYAEIEKKSIKDKLPNLEQAKRNITEESRRINVELSKSRAEVDKRNTDIRKLEKRINEIVDHIYTGFSKSVGLTNIREYEVQKQLKEAQEVAEERLNLSNQLAKLKYQVEYEQNRDVGSRIRKLESSISSLESDLEKIQKRKSELKELTEKATNEINNWKKEMGECKQKSEEYEKEILDWKKQASQATTSITKLDRQINSKETQIEQLISQKQEIAEQCELERIALPVLSDGPQYDFSELDRAHLPPSARDRMDAEYRQKIESKSSEIERTAPNLRALDQYEAIQEKEKQVSQEFEAARKEEKQVADAYNTVKQKRYELFMEAFNHISSIIDKIYKQLTKSNTHPLGGTAYLNLENEDDPFLQGIKYTTMPPTKRFRDMEQLSGGEKTVAALALLFSIHSYRPSPFFILDEVDAALDNLNVAKVAQFMRSRSCQAARENQDAEDGHGFQSIVISLKDSFYDKAEALVGVYRDVDKRVVIGSATLNFWAVFEGIYVPAVW
uniref:Structural maintenance of chromosomes protein n=1 Tax=Brassica campestris TaxID=3711 RepID=M4D9U4_BRACM